MNWREGKDPLGFPCELIGLEEFPIAIVTKDWTRYDPRVTVADDGEMVLWVVNPLGPLRLHGFAKDIVEAKRFAEAALEGLHGKRGVS